MIISVINHTNGYLEDIEVQHAISAINRQISRDFQPHWGRDATLRLEPIPHGERERLTLEALKRSLHDNRGAVIYLWSPRDVSSGLGYHATNLLGVPYGFVFPEVSRVLGEHWTITLSHEALEMIVDPEVNLLVMGPNPRSPRSTVYHWYEVCDAVATQTYTIDGVPVSNFVLPLYFTNAEEQGSYNDFLSLATGVPPNLRSFGTVNGAYVGFWDPAAGRHDFYIREGDTIAWTRRELRQQLALARRSQRSQYRTVYSRPITDALRHYLNHG